MDLMKPLTSMAHSPLPGCRDLAHADRFWLGPLEIIPSSCELRFGSSVLKIQPLEMRVLLALAAAYPEICSRDDLVRDCWDNRIVGDDAIHRVISLLRRHLCEASDRMVTIETVAKVGYCLSVPAASDRARLARGPARRTGDEVETRSLKHGSILGLGLAIGAAMTALYFLGGTSRGPKAPIIVAVTAENGTAANREFASRLAGDLAEMGSAMPTLSFVGADGPVRRTALRLSVSMQQTTLDPARAVQLQLTEAGGGTILWSRDFSSRDGDLARLHERVATTVAGITQCGLDRAADFADPVALRLYLSACDAVEMRDWPKARSFAEQIARLAPRSASAWACLAMTTVHEGYESDPRAAASNAVLLAKAQRYVDRALALDPGSGLAYQASATIGDLRGKDVLAILEKGVALDPDHSGLQMRYAMALLSAGYVRAAIEPALRAIALQPNGSDQYKVAFLALATAGRWDEAGKVTDKMERLFGGATGIAFQRAELLGRDPNPKSALRRFAGLGLPDGAFFDEHRELLRWRAAPEDYEWSAFDAMARGVFAADPSEGWNLAYLASLMQDHRRAVSWLQRSPATPRSRNWSIFDAELKTLQRDPRFFAKLAEVGLVNRWRATGRWPDFCSDPHLAYDCRSAAAALAVSTKMEMVDALGLEPRTR